MIKTFFPESAPLEISSDLAAASPVYLHWPQDKRSVCYSTDPVRLLEYMRDQNALKVSPEGISSLLTSGVIPHPKTVYKDLYILGIGDSAKLQSVSGKVDVQFSYDFPFDSGKRPVSDGTEPTEQAILELLAQETLHRLDEGKPAFLFHSAGKDSNSIALALAEAGAQSRVSLVTHKSGGSKDESEISASIARKLGFRHRTLHEVEDFSQPGVMSAIKGYFEKSPFPCTDGVSMAYPLYGWQMPELKSGDVVDGMGNDVYMGHIPASDEFRKQKLSAVLRFLRPLSRSANSESLWYSMSKSRAEHTGLFGFSFKDAAFLYSEYIDPAPQWSGYDRGQDYLDLRAEVRGGVIDQEIFIRKVRNFVDAYGNRLVLPWASESVSRYFMSVPEKHLFDRKHLKNKLILRRMLKNRLDLDSDKLGKLGYSYDKSKVVIENRGWVEEEIMGCRLWSPRSASRIINRLYSVLGRTDRRSQVAATLIYRLLLLSLWHNYSRFL